jgi:23S rRNA pseudouridine1911/1915/1917 synthase
MAKPNYIELGDGEHLPILYEDRSVLAIDKPRGWMLVPYNWQKTIWNLQAAIDSSIRAGLFWATSRNLKFLRHVHRLDADTTGILLLAKSVGAVDSYGRLFETRQMEKIYLVVINGKPPQQTWVSEEKIAPHPKQIGKMQIDAVHGKQAVTEFRVLQQTGGRTLLEAHPTTGRTHQIRIHLAHRKFPVVGDSLYNSDGSGKVPLGLRAIELAYQDPFTRKHVRIQAPTEQFMREFGFAP